MNQPKFSIIYTEKHGKAFTQTCACCGKNLKNFFIVLNNQENRSMVLGSTCVDNYLHTTLKDIYEENEAYEKACEASREAASLELAKKHF